MAIPPLRFDGHLPEGVYSATITEVARRFGSSTPRRKVLMKRLTHWVRLSQSVGAKRLLIDGSFVSAKENPGDVDVIVQTTLMYYSLRARNDKNALELAAIIDSRKPEELFEVDNNDDWDDWVKFFGINKEFSRVRKGMLEVKL